MTGSPAPAVSRCTRSVRGPAIRSAWRSASVRRASGSPRTAASRGDPASPAWCPRTCPRIAEDTNALCVHNMHRARTRPERLFLQFHGSVYRSDDEGGTWNDIPEGLPSGFGFPLVVDPADPDSAFVIPLNADATASRPTARSASSRHATRGNPGSRGEGASGTGGVPHDLPAGVRHGRRRRRPELYFGATSGDVFGSADAGASWFSAHERLAPVTSVRVA